MILVAIFIVFMFQYFSRKKGDDNDVDEDRLTQLTKRKVDEMVRQYQSANIKDEPQEWFVYIFNNNYFFFISVVHYSVAVLLIQREKLIVAIRFSFAIANSDSSETLV